MIVALLMVGCGETTLPAEPSLAGVGIAAVRVMQYACDSVAIEATLYTDTPFTMTASHGTVKPTRVVSGYYLVHWNIGAIAHESQPVNLDGLDGTNLIQYQTRPCG